jgi:acetyltransferase-like isoleucine patch superfamily enzyme
MSLINRLILDVKRSQSPGVRLLRSLLRVIASPSLFRLPAFLKPAFHILYELHFLVIAVVRWILVVCYRHPLFQSRCAAVGRGVVIHNLPFVSGHVEISLGNRVALGGNVSILSGRIFDHPQLIVKDHAEIGWNSIIIVNQEVTIEERARISFDCRISDSDGHPREADLRAQGMPPKPKDIRPVRICRDAWVGNGSYIMKGVTIGEGAIIGANSVVISDIPPYSLAMGNPAEVYFRNYGRPSRGADGGRQTAP